MEQETNEQALIDRGTAAQQLLSEPVFQSCYNTLTNLYVSAFFQSEPDNEKVRKHAYDQMKALQDLVAILGQWVAIKDNIMAANNESADEAILADEE